MTAVSTEDHKAASTEIGNHFLTDIYVQTVNKMIEKHDTHWKHWGDGWMSMLAPFKPSYVWDYHHITIGGHRQSGKTEAILRLIKPGDLIINCHLHTRAYFVERLVDRHGLDHGMMIATAIGIKRMIAAGQTLPERPGRIWVDDSHWIYDQRLGRVPFAKWLIAQYGHDVPVVISIG